MIRITLFASPTDTEGTTLQAETGQSLMQVAVRANVDGIAADCGGTLTCATCHVMVREPWAALLPPMSEDEDSMLDFAASPRQPNSRLSCQIALNPALDGIQVDMPKTQY